MNEQAWQWIESLGHWLLVWSVVVVLVGVWLLSFRPRRASVRYAGWLFATFSGAAFLVVAFFVSPMMSWQQAIAVAEAPAEPDSIELPEPFPEDTEAPAVGSIVAEKEPVISAEGLLWLVVALWGGGATMFLSRLIFAALRVRRLLADSTGPSETLFAEFDQAKRELRSCRDVRLAVHPTVAVPVCMGVVRPTVLCANPENDGMSRSQRRAAMVHELAHLTRYDDWVELAAELWRSLTWLYIPVHWTIRRLRREQEFLCDDAAASQLERPDSYAQLLLDVARVGVPSRVFCPSMTGSSTIASRVRRLLAGDFNRTPLSRAQVALLSCLFLLLFVGACSLRLVGFLELPEAAGASDASVGQVPGRVLDTLTAQEAAANGEPDAADEQTRNDDNSEAEKDFVEAIGNFGGRVTRDDEGRVYWVAFDKAPEFSDSDFKEVAPALRKLRALKRLSLGHTKISDTSLQKIEDLPHLTGLWLDGTNITDRGLENLRGLTNLTHLNLGETNLTDEGAKHLSGMTDLVFLYLGGTGISDDGLRHLKPLRALGLGLYLGGTKVTDKGLVHLRDMTNLGTLTLPETITDDGVVQLKGLRDLTTLGLRDTKVTDASLKRVSEMTKLQFLFLERTRISDVGLADLKTLSELQFLWLNGTSVTDAGLKHLEGLKSLKNLFLQDTKVSLKGVNRLKEALPDCKIHFP